MIFHRKEKVKKQFCNIKSYNFKYILDYDYILIMYNTVNIQQVSNSLLTFNNIKVQQKIIPIDPKDPLLRVKRKLTLATLSFLIFIHF